MRLTPLLLLPALLLASTGEPYRLRTAGPCVDGERDDWGTMDVLYLQYRAVFGDALGRRCLYSPSCSVYGQEAMRRSGPLLGTMTALERWTRCAPASVACGDYQRVETGAGMRYADPVDHPDRGEVTSWGRSLLPF